jgi:glycosyltransferase involved in cell wall biosynthesis
VNRRGAPKDRVRVIPAGIRTPPAHHPPFARAGAVPIVGTLGDVEKIEAQVDFICAAPLVLAEQRDVEFLIVTGGSEPRSLRTLTRDLGVSRHVTFTSFVDTQKSLSLMDICVLPGAEEGPAQAIIEAMAGGRPVIASGAGGAYAVIEDEQTGLICEKADREGPSLPATLDVAAKRGRHLAAAILRLTRDCELARRLGASAREVVIDRFPLDRMLDETMAAYEDARGRSRSEAGRTS